MQPQICESETLLVITGFNVKIFSPYQFQPILVVNRVNLKWTKVNQSKYKVTQAHNMPRNLWGKKAAKQW